MKLPVKTVKKVKHKRDKDSILYSRKAMIRFGLALNLNAKLEERQLFPHLQQFIRKYQDNYEGGPVNEADDLAGERTETDSDQHE